jgi:hypothetical protein
MTMANTEWVPFVSMIDNNDPPVADLSNYVVP